MPDVHLMHKTLAILAGCALLAACGSSPTSPSTAPTLTRTRFLAFGDSITAGEVTVPVGVIREGLGGLIQTPSTRMIVVPAASYPTQLLSLLQGRYATQAAAISVTNGGNPGETVAAGSSRFPDTLASSGADVAIVMEGVNGISLLGPDLSTAFMRSMVRTAKTISVRTFVGSMIPTIPGRQRSQVPADLVAYNAALQQMAREEGVEFVDLYTTLLPEANSVIGVDGLHPTEVGYKRIADMFFAAVQANLEVTSK
jgi:lysophospholipase L1-like esterase